MRRYHVTMYSIAMDMTACRGSERNGSCPIDDPGEEELAKCDDRWARVAMSSPA